MQLVARLEAFRFPLIYLDRVEPRVWCLAWRKQRMQMIGTRNKGFRWVLGYLGEGPLRGYFLVGKMVV